MTTNQPDLDELDQILRAYRYAVIRANKFSNPKAQKEAKEAILALIEKEKIEARKSVPDDIKGVMVSGVKTLQNEMDMVSIQDLRLLITAQEQRLLLNGSKSKKEGKE